MSHVSINGRGSLLPTREDTDRVLRLSSWEGGGEHPIMSLSSQKTKWVGGSPKSSLAQKGTPTLLPTERYALQ